MNKANVVAASFLAVGFVWVTYVLLVVEPGLGLMFAFIPIPVVFSIRGFARALRYFSAS